MERLIGFLFELEVNVMYSRFTIEWYSTILSGERI